MSKGKQTKKVYVRHPTGSPVCHSTYCLG
uniref:Uncharacterized protein n=1 Tax=Anguilla anguilla TaxID=7936 RepID=A0A0E9PHQ3_ANGAN